MSPALTPLVVVLIVFVAMVALQRTLSRGIDYECRSCGHRFHPSPVAGALAPHRLGGSKLLRCPRCGSWTWATAVPKR